MNCLLAPSPDPAGTSQDGDSQSSRWWLSQRQLEVFLSEIPKATFSKGLLCFGLKMRSETASSKNKESSVSFWKIPFGISERNTSYCTCSPKPNLMRGLACLYASTWRAVIQFSCLQEIYWIWQNISRRKPAPHRPEIISGLSTQMFSMYSYWDVKTLLSLLDLLITILKSWKKYLAEQGIRISVF